MPGPSRRLLIPLVMKKVRIILPVLAFLFAVVAAFATNESKSEVEEYFLKIEEEPIPCERCNPNSQNNDPEVQCTPVQKSNMCFCNTGTTAADQLHVGTPQSCDPLWRNSQ
jgi:hypothetical protein